MVHETVYRFMIFPCKAWLFEPIQPYMHGTPLCIVYGTWYAPSMHDTGT